MHVEFNFDGLELTHYMQLWADKGALVNGLCLPNVFHQSSRGGLKEILLSRLPPLTIGHLLEAKTSAEALHSLNLSSERCSDNLSGEGMCPEIKNL